MSTADSQLLVTSAALAEDLLPVPGRREERDQARHAGLDVSRDAGRAGSDRLRNGRIAVAVVCAIAAWLALDPGAGVLALVAHAWAGFGATIGPLLLVLLYDRHACGTGAVAGLLTGAATVGLWPLLPGGGYGVYELLPAFLAALASNLLVNRRRPRLSDETTA